MLSDSEMFVFKDGRKLVRVYCSDIVFFESNGHYINIHMKSGEVHRTRGTMAMLERVLSSRFMKVRRGIVVNADFIKAADSKAVILDSVWGSVPVGSKYKCFFEEAFNELWDKTTEE